MKRSEQLKVEYNPRCSKSSKILNREHIRVFQRKLLRWYAQHGRDLPWRHTCDPYHILVSEMMLHQTQVNRVKSKYLEWLIVYPTFEALAAAPLEEIKQLWRPLGYNFRPERLHQIAKYVVHELDGKLPETLNELIMLPGIGRYTAGAILSFAFHKDAPIVDTNICRFIQRYFGIQDNPTHAIVKRKIWKLVKSLIPRGKAYVFNQAIIDFGALICTSRVPACLTCFVKEHCLTGTRKRHLHNVEDSELVKSDQLREKLSKPTRSSIR